MPICLSSTMLEGDGPLNSVTSLTSRPNACFQEEPQIQLHMARDLFHTQPPNSVASFQHMLGVQTH